MPLEIDDVNPLNPMTGLAHDRYGNALHLDATPDPAPEGVASGDWGDWQQTDENYRHPVVSVDPRVDVGASDVIVTGQVAFTASTTARIIPASPSRRRITLKCLTGSVGVVYLASSSTMANGTTLGYPLAAGESVQLETSAELWGFCSAAGTATIALIGEHVDEP